MPQFEHWQTTLLEGTSDAPTHNSSAEWFQGHAEQLFTTCNSWAEHAAQTAQQEHWMDPELDWRDQQRLVVRRLTGDMHFSTPRRRDLSAYPSPPLKTAAALNLLGSCRSRRKDGKLYTFHPMVVDFVVAFLATLPENIRDMARVAALTHDLLEEDLVRVFKQHERTGDQQSQAFLAPDFSLSLTANVRQARVELNSGHYRRFAIGDLALDLMEPLLEDEHIPDELSRDEASFYTQARIIFWLNWRAQGHPHYRPVKIADKVHDVLDLGYITDNPKLTSEQRTAKLATKFAKIFFSTTCFNLDQNGVLQSDAPADLWDLFTALFRAQLQKYAVDTSVNSLFAQHVLGYYEAYRNYKPQFALQCSEYASEVGLPDLPRIV